VSALSPKFTITDAIARDLTLIERARGFLEAARLSDDWLTQMRDRALLLEAHYTTHIEGTQLTLDQAEQIWAGKKIPSADADDVRELLNYRGAFELVRDYLGSPMPITEAVLREIHKRLVQGVRGDSARPGQYRHIQNYVANNKTGQVVYTPPPPHDVAPMMEQLVAWLNAPTTIHSVLAAGIAQFQLVHIHPFIDGNGRASRLLSTMCLYRSGYDFKGLFTLSEFYDRDRPAFYAALQSVRQTDLDLTRWLEFFSGGLATQLTEVKVRGEMVIGAHVLGKTHKLNDRQTLILGQLMMKGPMGMSEIEQLNLGANRRTLQRDLKLMMAKKLVTESGSGPTDRTRKYSYDKS
jgi:Fic family protein